MQTDRIKRKAVTAFFALIISTLALLVSFASFYFQNIRKYQNVKVTIVRALPAESLLTADIVFTNNGNQKCSIISVDLERENLAGERIPIMISPCSNFEAFTIKENDVITKQLACENHFSKILNTEAKQGDRFEWRLVFDAVDSEGQLHEVKMPIVSKTLGFGKIELSQLPKVINLLPSPVLKQALSFPISTRLHDDKNQRHRSQPLEVLIK